jgi:hypothetical protein
MTPIQARARFLDLLAEQGDLEPALRALDLWEAVIQVVPRREVVATIDTDCILCGPWWVNGRRHRVREDAFDVERDRLLAMCSADAAAYGVARHMALRVRDHYDEVANETGAEIWAWGKRTPAFECLGTYEPLAKNLEPVEEDA